MPRRRFADFLQGTTTADILDDDSSFDSAELAAMPTVGSLDFIAVTLGIDTDTPEIVWVTSHGSASTSASIDRGKEATTAAAWPAGTKWAAADTAAARTLQYSNVGPVFMISSLTVPTGAGAEHDGVVDTTLSGADFVEPMFGSVYFDRGGLFAVSVSGTWGGSSAGKRRIKVVASGSNLEWRFEESPPDATSFTQPATFLVPVEDGYAVYVSLGQDSGGDLSFQAFVTVLRVL